MKILDQSYVETHLTVDACLSIMEQALKDERSGSCVQYLRTAIDLPNTNILGLMPAYYSEGFFGVKVISVYHTNGGTGYPSHQGAILLFENEHGELLASVDAMSITKIRTGAVSAVASRALANPDSKVLAILGCGAQGYSHLDALAKTFDLTEFRCWDVNKASAEALAACAQTKKSLNSKACATVEEAVYGADIICTVTPAKAPILCRGWVKDGAHINAIGACAPTTRELDSDLMADAHVYCDNTESILHESGDFLIPLGENRFGKDHLIGTVGDVLLGKLSGRKGRNEITIFDAVGMAVEDIACAIYLYHQSLG